MIAKHPSTVEHVQELAARLLDVARVWPVVVITRPAGEPAPLIDAERLARDVAPVPVHVLATHELTWELTSLLPDGLSVYGGAARIWWPGLSPASRRHEHPLFFAFDRAEGKRAAERLREELARRDEQGEREWLLWQRRHPPRSSTSSLLLPRPHPPGQVVAGRVVHAGPGGADVEVAEGVTGWLVRRRRDRELVVGERVTVRVVRYEGDEVVLDRAAPEVEPARRTPVSVRPVPGPPGQRVPVGRAARSGGADDAQVLQDQVAGLRLQLLAVDEERRSAEVRADQAAAELTQAVKAGRQAAQEQRRRLRSYQDRIAFLEQELHGTGRFDDAEEQFRHEVEVAWSNATVGDDRTAWPLQDHVVGPFFLSSVAALAGVGRRKVVEVCVDVVSDRVRSRPERELHPLRAGDGGDCAQLVRADGAKAYRVALQVGVPAARRLHFWRLPDGRVELSKVGVHDDLTIA